MTMSACYDAAMHIENQEEADAYFEVLLDRCCARDPMTSRTEQARIQRSNLGYWAGYYSDTTRERVERLFRCAHPVFGAIAVAGPVTTDEAFRKGLEAGEAARNKAG